MSCRGPDGTGLWSDNDHRIVLGHRRLSIIDLSAAGAQPMHAQQEGLAISFNGEIYNYRALRDGLEEKGHRFLSASDTEVLLRLYADYGVHMLGMLRGMFAFALWDGPARKLVLARDPFGVKPLYYSDNGQAISIASEVKALLATNNISKVPDPAGHAGFFLWGHVPEPHTLYQSIRALPAGTWMSIDDEGPHGPTPYVDLAATLSSIEQQPPVATTPAELRATIRAALLDSVRHHLVSDVDVGVFLSSGLDSATIAGLAAEIGGRVRTITLGFEEYKNTPNDETVLAERIAHHYSTDHTTVWISKEDFRSELPRILERMDQPSIDGINSYFVARAAAQTGLKVALSGLGGDELFGGYPSFRQIPRLVSTVRRLPGAARLGKGVRRLTAPWIASITSPKYASLLEYATGIGPAYLLRRSLFLPWELSSLLGKELIEDATDLDEVQSQLSSTISSIRTDRFKISTLEARWYMQNQLLRDTDWASMSHSVEVRVPLVDWSLWLGISKLIRQSPGIDKLAMATTLAQPLPDSVLNRPKTGFQIPTREWMTGGAAGQPRGLRGWAQFVYRELAA